MSMFCFQCQETAKGTGCDGRMKSREYYTQFAEQLPAFLSPNVTQVLVDNFNIAGITNPAADIQMFMV
jgi:hydroxylamine reductase (hybrid-cluster protein)